MTGERDVLGNLPKARPSRRSSKRESAGAAGASDALDVPKTAEPAAQGLAGKAAKPKAKAAKPKAPKPKAAKPKAAKPKAAGRKVPKADGPVPQPADRTTASPGARPTGPAKQGGTREPDAGGGGVLGAAQEAAKLPLRVLGGLAKKLPRP